MRIKLSPQRRDDALNVSKLGDTLMLNGELFDFSSIGEGDSLPVGAIQSEWFIGDVKKENGELVLTLILPNPENYSQAQAFPADLINVPDGPVDFPKPLTEPEIETPTKALP